VIVTSTVLTKVLPRPQPGRSPVLTQVKFDYRYTSTQSNMLDIQGLPKNANGFRTTHTCELCGFEPKTKNKYREKQDHLVMKHFKERIDKIFPHCRPYSCPNTECGFEGKDKQALLRHYTGKHGVLELYLKEALMARGINYHLSDSAKRKSMGNQNQDGNKAKHARMSPPLETTILPPSPYQEDPDTTTILPSEYSEPITYHQPITRLPTIPTTKLPSMSTVFTRTKPTQPTQSEVDAMIASFEPSEYQISATVLPPSVITSQSQSEQPIGNHIVSSTTLDLPTLPTLFLPISESSKLILDNNIMWGSGNSSFSVESNQTVPVHYLENSDSGFVNLGDIDYDYLYPATVDPCAVQAISNSSSSISQTILPFTDL